MYIRSLLFSGASSLHQPNNIPTYLLSSVFQGFVFKLSILAISAIVSNSDGR